MTTPCDISVNGTHYCPFEDYTGYESERCQVCCGLGVDEDPYPEEEYYDPFCNPDYVE